MGVLGWRVRDEECSTSKAVSENFPGLECFRFFLDFSCTELQSISLFKINRRGYRYQLAIDYTGIQKPQNILTSPLLCSNKYTPNLMIFFSFFKTLVGKKVMIELKNDLTLVGTLHSVDQYLNVKLEEVQIVDQKKFPQLTSVKSIFVRGSTVRYVQIPRNEVDTELLQDAALKEFEDQ